VVVPLGLVGLAAYSVAIELIQLELARIDRACDVTDVVDNVSGAGIGVVVGLVLVLVFRPWRHRR
jgi:glycopeptide antibiotics resistance protein